MQFKKSNVAQVVALALLAVSAAPVMAQSAGDNIVSTGWVHIAPQDSSTPLSITSPASLAGPIPNSGASVKSTDTLGFSITHFFTNNWAGSFDLGIPPTYKLEGTGSLAAVGQIGEAKQLAPTLIAKYFFGQPQSVFRPFVGLGASRVSYTGVSLTDTFQGAVRNTLAYDTAGQVIAVGTSAKLEDSWASVFNVGASYAINKDWYAGFSLSYLKLKTKADLTTQSNVGPIMSTTTLTLNPIVTYLSIGYRF